MSLQTKTYTKGSTAWGSELNAYKLSLTITEESTNTANNTSLISYKFQIESGNNAFNLWTTTRKLILNGVTLENETSQLSLAKYSTLVYFEGSTNVKHNSDGKLDMTIVASIDMTDESSTLIPGDVTFNETMTLTPISVYTKCTAPTSFTVTPNPFESGVTFAWDGASGGTNNPISTYSIRCAISTNGGSSYGDWITVWTDSRAEGYTTVSFGLDWLSKYDIAPNRGDYLKFSIRTNGTAGDGYHSDWTSAVVVRRNPYTACTAPTTFTVPPLWNTGFTLYWSGASGGEGNDIVGYTIECRYRKEGADWNDNWIQVWSYTNEVSVTLSADWLESFGIEVDRGNYFQFRIRTRGSAGSEYYSDWIESGITRRRNPSGFIHTGTTTERYASYINTSVEGFNKYLPYWFDGAQWKPFSG